MLLPVVGKSKILKIGLDSSLCHTGSQLIHVNGLSWEWILTFISSSPLLGVGAGMKAIQQPTHPGKVCRNRATTWRSQDTSPAGFRRSWGPLLGGAVPHPKAGRAPPVRSTPEFWSTLPYSPAPYSQGIGRTDVCPTVIMRPRPWGPHYSHLFTQGTDRTNQPSVGPVSGTRPAPFRYSNRRTTTSLHFRQSPGLTYP